MPKVIVMNLATSMPFWESNLRVRLLSSGVIETQENDADDSLEWFEGLGEDWECEAGEQITIIGQLMQEYGQALVNAQYHPLCTDSTWMETQASLIKKMFQSLLTTAGPKLEAIEPRFEIYRSEAEHLDEKKPFKCYHDLEEAVKLVEMLDSDLWSPVIWDTQRTDYAHPR